MFLEDCPARRLRDRYISIDDVEDKCGITKERCQKLIDDKKIKYAEFRKPEEYFRSVFVDPVEIDLYLNKRSVKKL